MTGLAASQATGASQGSWACGDLVSDDQRDSCVSKGALRTRGAHPPQCGSGPKHCHHGNGLQCGRSAHLCAAAVTVTAAALKSYAIEPFKRLGAALRRPQLCETCAPPHQLAIWVHCRHVEFGRARATRGRRGAAREMKGGAPCPGLRSACAMCAMRAMCAMCAMCDRAPQDVIRMLPKAP